MSAPTTWVVTPAGGAPYRVLLREGADAWSAEVERGGERWSFSIAPGPAEGLARAGDRSLRWRWDRGSGRLVLNGVAHPLEVQSEAAHRLAGLDGRSRAATRTAEVRAPMPGLVLALEVEEGTAVAAGQGLLVLEAMKMENEITAPAAGVVRGLAVRAGEAVERGTLLCRIEPPEAQP